MKSEPRVVQCPRCQANYRLEVNQANEQPQPPIRCTKCGSVFETPLPTNETLTTPPDSLATLPPADAITRGISELPEDKSMGLSVIGGPQKGKIFQLTKPYVVLGRTEADIALDAPRVSRRHCALEIYRTQALLIDLDSTNGTFVDEKKIKTCELEHLSDFTIGATTLMLTVTPKRR